MSFELVRFAREISGTSGHVEVSACARRAAAQACGQRAFVAHVFASRPWEDALILSADGRADASAVALRSAMFAVFRRLSLRTETTRLQRSSQTAAIFRALVGDEVDALEVLPLRSNGGRLTGALVTGATTDEARANLEAIAEIAGPSMDRAARFALARRDQERLQLLSETTQESVWDLNVATDEMWWGGNVEQLFGLRISVSKRSDWRRARIHPADVERVIASFEAAIAGSDASWSSEYRLASDDGRYIDASEHAFILRETDARAYRVIGTIRDVSLLRQLLQKETLARAQAERANVVKDEFLAMLGHELRNPLAPIVSVLALLERRATGPDRPLEILRRQTQHLVRLVDDLLDVSRISSGKVELDLRRVAVEPLVQRAAEMVQPLLEQRRHRLVIDVEPDLALDADAVRMTQVFSNLMANAAKYTEPGGRVSVTAATEEGQPVVRIRDNGIGIAPDFLPVIFDMFSQGRQALDRAAGGLGLGL